MSCHHSQLLITVFNGFGATPAERGDHGRVVLERRVRDVIVEPDLFSGGWAIPSSIDVH